MINSNMLFGAVPPLPFELDFDKLPPVPFGSRRCFVCDRAAPFECGKCHSAWYCSVSCQEKDHATHRLVCDMDKWSDVIEAYGYWADRLRRRLAELRTG